MSTASIVVTVSDIPFVRMELQQGKGDCAMTALAMYTGKPYLAVVAASVSKRRSEPWNTGLKVHEIKRMARRLGLTLVLKRSWDLEADCGLLSVERTKEHKDHDKFPQHLVLLKWGLIFDTDGTVWEPESYFETEHFRPISLLVCDERRS